ncbi:hypothetical protein K439DRAFT_1635060 [Ramaria rubella]|nr:hypothetical protein K439DRAFT_1635060 [Ramaria rubella]
MKRTRGDLIRELKEKRTSGGAKAHSEGPSTDVAFEQAKKTGKFKPIGVSESTKAIEKNNKTKGKGQEKLAEGERKKKRRKVGPESMIAKDQSHSVQSTKTLNMLAAQLPEAATTSPEAPEVDTSRQKTTGPLVENYDGVDIFADAGEYEGVDFGDEEGEELPDNARATEPVVDPSGSGVPVVKGWFEDDPVSIPSASAARLPTPPPAEPIPGENKELNQEQVTRLAPLASSALPSISDFLAMDAHAEAQQKRKAKKEKKKGEKKEKASVEVKVDRDYKRLNSYMARKEGGSKDI